MPDLYKENLRQRPFKISPRYFCLVWFNVLPVIPFKLYAVMYKTSYFIERNIGYCAYGRIKRPECFFISLRTAGNAADRIRAGFYQQSRVFVVNIENNSRKSPASRGAGVDGCGFSDMIFNDLLEFFGIFYCRHPFTPEMNFFLFYEVIIRRVNHNGSLYILFF